jgi:hypothetical protein
MPEAPALAAGIGLGGYLGRSTFVTGPGKGCGKTSYLNAVLAGLRKAGERPGILGIGFDGESRDGLTQGERPRIPVFPGETVLTAGDFLGSSRARFEILDILPGGGAFGRYVIARVLRRGDALLVGPESNEKSALAIARMRGEFGVGTILADGAMNRMTPVSASGGARFVFVLRVERKDLERQIAAMKRIHRLASLPRAMSAPDEAGKEARIGGLAGLGGESRPFVLRGPLSPLVAARLDASDCAVTVEDFTKIFLDSRQLDSFSRRHSLSVARGIEFAGFAVILRNLDRDEFLSALGDETIAKLVAFNPCEAGAEPRFA